MKRVLFFAFLAFTLAAPRAWSDHLQPNPSDEQRIWLGVKVGSTIPGYEIVELGTYPVSRSQYGGPTESIEIWATDFNRKDLRCVAVVNFRYAFALGSLSQYIDKEHRTGISTTSPGKEVVVYGDCVTKVRKLQ